MIRIVADNFLKEETKEEFVKIAAEMVEKTRKEAGNISYGLHQDRKDPLHLTFIEEWESQEAIDAHNASAHFKKLVPLMHACAASKGTCYRYDILL